MKFKKVFLKDISIKNRGAYGIGASAVDFNEKLPKYLRITDINDDGSINFLELKSVDDKNYQKYILKENDIVFARTGNSTGKNYFYNPADGELVYAGFLIKFSLNPEKVFPEYVKYYCMSSEYWGWVGGFSSGSTRKNINAKIYGELPLFLPSVENQKKIVNILNPLSKRIDINQKIIITLEEIVETLFNHWFINFEFPDKKGNPYKSNGGKMIESELGEIPGGWEVKNLGDLVTFEYGKALKKENRLNGKYPVYGSGGVVGYHNEYLIKGPSIIVGRKGTVGSIYYSEENSFPIDTTFWIKPKLENLSMGFTLLILKNQDFSNLISDSAVPGLNRNVAYQNKVIFPAEKIMLEFNAINDSLLKNINSLKKENETLKELRDTLLPKLLSGEIELE
ncbi:restriction endonuclease subunit S [Candidatus Enterococcus ikei]|uniref:Restriction endonuclease subunit S n=1 Tax=Candidatus Enterococcus ikei TaxID=2815326 RepID=A0ABS3GWQ1_9ENTE|nr:restriction endonuclease subunit S [Enterococcus sp. DIV0869a]MBO0439615.1 restriction endonuclease subunit S [Enterococcus sp. DIV0869a]